jgi:hypothetical protein
METHRLKPAPLEAFPKEFENGVPNQAGYDGDYEIFRCENVQDCDGQSFAAFVGAREFSHQEIGIKQENDKADFDERPPDRGKPSRFRFP